MSTSLNRASLPRTSASGAACGAGSTLSSRIQFVSAALFFGASVCSPSSLYSILRVSLDAGCCVWVSALCVAVEVGDFDELRAGARSRSGESTGAVLVVWTSGVSWQWYRLVAESEEDLALKQQLELYVERVQDPDPRLQKVALESMSTISVDETDSEDDSLEESDEEPRKKKDADADTVDASPAAKEVPMSEKKAV
ncbi:hypothetical protein NL676_034761 [Syzygium grande]|nr:hypothetical protein NL676_034761 [Syzygium grande]